MSEYIEREALLEAVINLPAKMDEQGYGWLGRRGVWQMALDFPAADVRPVVRGKWTGNARHQSCSECHMTYCVPDGQDGEIDMTPYHFCPNCGADMREES